MKYYDLVFDTCEYDEDFAGRLGFAQIFKIKKEDSRIVIGDDAYKLAEGLHRGARLLAITDFSIDKTLLAKAKDNDAILCISLSMITKSAQSSRPALLYKASALAKYALSMRIDLSIASLADSKSHMLSYMQIVELARLIGIEKEKARMCISTVNKIAGELCGKDKA